MLRNYIKIALRNLTQQKAHTVINVTGLSLGIACCLIIFLLVRHEWRFDRFHEHADRLYRIGLQYDQPDGSIGYQNMMFPDFTPQLEAEFPAIEHATRLVAGNLDYRSGEDVTRHQTIEVDSAFFRMFTFPTIAGTPETALRDPGSVVITEKMANSVFDADRSFDSMIGEPLTVEHSDQQFQFTIQGIVQTPPEHSSIQFDAAISFENYDNIYLGGNNWGGRTSTYLLLAQDQGEEDLEAALPPFTESQYGDYAQRARSAGALAEGEDTYRLLLQPLLELHHQPEVWTPYEVTPQNPLYSYILSGIGLLVLLIGCINFVTLSIGRAAKRTREVGMRKVLGARRSQLMRQFWGEAVVLTAIAVLVGFVLTWGGLPFVNNLSNLNLSLGDLNWFELPLAFLVLLLVVGVVAGSYPAAILSAQKPALVLKGHEPARKQRLTRGLVVLQYTISIGLIACTVVMARQMDFLLSKDLGFDEDMVVVVNTRQVSRSEAPLVLRRLGNRLAENSNIVAVERTGHSFAVGSDRNTWTDADGITRSAYNFGVGYDYIDLMGMEIVAGRNFSPQFPADSTNSVLVNETLVEEFGIEDPVGKQLTGWLDWLYEESPTVIGVVKDYHFRSLHEEIQPVVLNMHPDYYSFMGAILIKIRPTDVAGSIKAIESAWSEAVPDRPLSYNFLDEDLASQYQDEQRWSRITQIASLLAILIACMGLFGLATLSVTRRKKEIGVRKVLGASIPGVVRLVVVEFVWLIGVAAVLALPLAWIAMQRWLDAFAHHVDIGVTALVAAPLAALFIALATISYQVLQAASIDPAKVLRHE